MKKLTSLLLSIAVAFLATPVVQAANECRIKITYQGNKTKYVNINVNQRKTINQSELTRIKNLKTNAVELKIQNPTTLIQTEKLKKNQQHPPFVNYIGLYILKSAKCLSTDGNFASPAALINALLSSKSMGEIVAQLNNLFNLSDLNIAKELKKAGLSPDKIASGLKNGLNKGGKDVAKLLHQAGLTPKQVVEGMAKTFKRDAKTIAGWMKQAGIPVDDIVKGTAQFFKKNYSAELALLKDIGYERKISTRAVKKFFNTKADLIAAALKRDWNATKAQAKAALEFAGYTKSQVQTALNKVWGGVKRVVKKTADAVAREMKSQGKNAIQIATELKKNFGMNPRKVAAVLRKAGFPPKEIILSLKNVFNASAEAIAIEMKRLGFDRSVVETGLKAARFPLKAITRVLDKVYGIAQSTRETAEQVLARLRKEGKPVKQVIAQIRRTFKTRFDSMAIMMKRAGYRARDIAEAGVGVYRTTARQTAIELKRLGFKRAATRTALSGYFSANAIEEALNAVFGPDPRSSNTSRPTSPVNSGSRTPGRPVSNRSSRPSRPAGAAASIQVIAKNRAEVLGKPRDRNNARPMAKLTMGSVSKATPMSVLVGGANNRCGAPNSFLMKPRLVARQTFTVTRLANYPAFRTQAALNKVGSSLLYLCAQPEGGSCSCSKLP